MKSISNIKTTIVNSPIKAAKRIEFEITCWSGIFRLPKKYTFAVSIPKLKINTIIVGINNIMVHSPLPVGPKTLAMVILKKIVQHNWIILVDKVVKLSLIRLITQKDLLINRKDFVRYIIPVKFISSFTYFFAIPFLK